MKTSTILACLAMATVMTACGGDEKKATGGRIVSDTDFENLVGWVSEPSRLTREKAHSGSYSIFTDPTHEFSLTYESALGDISPQKFKKVRIEAWAYLQSPKGNASLGVQFTDPSQNNKAIGGEGIELGDAVKEYNKWVQVSKEITLPENITSANHMKVFIYRGMSTQAVFVDDLRIIIPE